MKEFLVYLNNIWILLKIFISKKFANYKKKKSIYTEI